VRVESGSLFEPRVYFASVVGMGMRKVVLELTDPPTVDSPDAVSRSFDLLERSVVNVSYDRGEAFYNFQAHVLSTPRNGRFAVSRPREVIRVQRRDYYRLPLQSPTTLRVLNAAAGSRQAAQQSTAVPARLLNLSGGGAMLSVRQPISAGSRAVLRIPSGREGEPMDVIAECLECRDTTPVDPDRSWGRADAPPNPAGSAARTYLARFRFAGPPMLDNDDREAIIAFIFEQQRMMLRLRRLVQHGA
jgi:hypothetical protein